MPHSNQKINMPSHEISPRRQAQFILAIASLVGIILKQLFFTVVLYVGYLSWYGAFW